MSACDIFFVLLGRFDYYISKKHFKLWQETVKPRDIVITPGVRTPKFLFAIMISEQYQAEHRWNVEKQKK